MKPATLIRPLQFAEMAHDLVAVPSLARGRSELILHSERFRAMRFVPHRSGSTRLRSPGTGPEMERRKPSLLLGLAASFAFAVIAAGSLLADPNEASARAIESMGPHALATIVLRLPQ